MTVNRKSTAPHFFFALTLPANIQQQLIEWRAQQFSADNGYPVAKQQLYLVLTWLNQASATQLEQIKRHAQRIQQPTFSLNINDAGYWPRSGQVWLGCQPAPRPLLQLATLLRSRAAHVGCQQSTLPFHPHITVLRQVTPPVNLPPRNFQWQLPVTEFVLLSSQPSAAAHRAKLQVEARFPLLAV